jgi:O-antigen/teichoic acid export membrane protein
MSEAADKKIPTIDAKPHAAFFRQSGWLMIATVAGGAMTFGVHFLSKKISETEYSVFGTLMMLVACVPAMPLQILFAYQSAQALATGREKQLSGMLRLAWSGTFILWLLAAGLVVFFQNDIVQHWQLSSPMELWVTLAVVLMSLWMPMFAGVMQGRQDFFWMGWSMIIGGVGRVALAALIVLAFNGGAGAMMFGALIGIGATAVIGIWRTRDLWSLPPQRFDGKTFFREITPLVLGFGACQFLFTADTMFAKTHFSGEEMAPYVAAGTLSRALLWVVLPLATVMFPKIVHSHARSEKTNLFNIVVLGTAALAVCGVLGLWLVGPWVIKLVYTPEYVARTMALLPWYAGAMVPLALANVMVNDLLARSRFTVVPFMVVLAVAYGVALPLMLDHFPGRLEIPLQTLAAFNTLLFGVCAWFTWGRQRRTKTPGAG